MPKVVLIQPPQRDLKEAKAYPPLGLCYLGAALLEAEIDVEVINFADRPIEDISIDNIPKADFYGITCVSATYPEVVQISKTLKKSVVGKVVMGGVHPSISPLQTYRESQCDYIIVGEGEYAFRNLVLGKKKPNEKIIYAGIIKYLDELPFPARWLFKKEEIVNSSGVLGQEKGVKATSILSSRGCPMKCSFCCRGHEMFTKFRYHSAGRVREEIKQIMDEYEVKFFRFLDDAFTANRRRALKLCKEIKDLECEWRCITRADWIDKGLLREMKEAGCVGCDFGIESGSQRVLDMMNKKLTVEGNIKAIKLMKDVGLSTKVLLMYGFPGETERDIELTKRFIREAKPDRFTLSQFTPLPGSDLYNRANNKRWFYPDEQGDKGYKELKKWLSKEVNI